MAELGKELKKYIKRNVESIHVHAQVVHRIDQYFKKKSSCT